MREPTVCMLLVSLALPLMGESPFAFRAVGPDSLELSENGRPVYVYNHGLLLREGAPEAQRRCCYVHPLHAPDGTVITDDFPADHYHHRGVFWTWPEVTVGGEHSDLWLIRGIRQEFVRWTARETSAASARLGVENGWYVGGRRVMRETVEIVAHPASGRERLLEFTLRFEALSTPLVIAGKQDGKGYGGFSMRFAPRENTVLRTKTGRETRDTDLVPHPWAALEASFEGHRIGARIDIDPSNPGYPNGWCLRHYGFLGVNYPGLEPLELRPGEPLVLRYRLTLYSVP